MKLMFASDIHGSRSACEAVLAAYKAEGAERLVLLGDLLYHGPRNNLPDAYDPKGVIALLNGVKNELLCVRGNCDAEVDQMVLQFPIMADYALLFAAGKVLYATHGHLFDADNPPPLSAGEILLNGHFHVPCHKEIKGGVLYANCGSVALPKNDTPHSYLLLENNELLWKDLGDECKVFDRLKL